MKGLINNHTEKSRFCSAMNVSALVKKAKEAGYEAVGISDYATMTGVDDFVAACKEGGIKPVIGVETYVCDDGKQIKNIVLIALDDTGIQGLSKYMTAANRNFIDDVPCVSKDDLKSLFGEGSKYHGHVIATSANKDGVIAKILLRNHHIEKSMAEKMSGVKVSLADDEANKKNLAMLQKQEDYLDQLRKEREDAMSVSKKSFKKKENALKKLSGDELKEAEAALEAEKKESAEALEALERLRLEISLTGKNITAIKNQIRDFEERRAKSQSAFDEFEKLQKELKSDAEILTLAKEEALSYQEIFGKGNFFLELQYHGYMADGKQTELDSMRSIARIAKELDIPVVASNDAHMTDNSADSCRAMELLRSLRYNTPDPLTKADRELFVKTEKDLGRAIIAVAVDAAQVNEAIENAGKICERCNYDFNIGKHYPKYQMVPEGETADSVLMKMAKENIAKKFKDGEFNKAYELRLEYELSVISKMGYSDYFLIVQDFLAFGRRLGHLSQASLDYLYKNIKKMTLKELVDYVDSHQERVGFAIGAGRGSAAGSLVAYLVGITDIVDPLKYDLLFERFLNEDRVSMPDVDSDFSPDIRDLVVEYCKKVYGYDSVANIVTSGYMAPKSAIRNVARIIGAEKGEAARYLVLADMISKVIPNKPGMNFESCDDLLVERFTDKPEDNAAEKKNKADCREIIRQAKLVEGVFINYGMHAAGVIIADGNPIDNYVPLMLDETSGGMKVQCNMVQAEELHGLLKFDFLGLRNLKIITKALRGIKISDGVEIDVTKLPMEAAVFENIFSKGYTGSVFQFESGGMKELLTKFKPSSFEDLIALVSLYRPGPMEFIPAYIAAKWNPESIHYLCPQLKPILGNTYGTIVYQEQVMRIFQELAGYSLSGADNVRRYMSKKKADKLEHEREAFIYGDEARGIAGCVKNGIDAKTANTLFDQMYSFASYAFNKSHAAAYAMLSYITAWLKFHYPAEYMCAVLNCTDNIDKMPSVLNDCKEMGVKVLPPDINRSEMDFIVLDEKTIIFGLNSVKGTREASSAKILENRKDGYESIIDFLERTGTDKATMTNLISAGAFDGILENRNAARTLYEEYQPLLKKRDDYFERKAALEKKAETSELTSREQTSLRKASESLADVEGQLSEIKPIDIPEDKLSRLIDEKKTLGLFVSEHPTAAYERPMSCKPIGEISVEDAKNQSAKYSQEVSYFGIVQNMTMLSRKSDKKPLAKFDLEDVTGRISVFCPVNAFDEIRDFVHENSLIIVRGKLKVEDAMSEDDEPTLELVLRSAEEYKPDLNVIAVAAKDIFAVNGLLKELRRRKLIVNSGHPLTFYDEMRKEFRKTRFYVSENVLFDDFFKGISRG